MTKENDIKKPARFGKCHIKFTNDSEGKVQFNFNPTTQSEDNILYKMTGVRDEELAQEIIDSGERALPERYDESKRNSVAYQTLADLEPKDSNEARLCLQAAALYSQGMNYLRRAERVLGDGTAIAIDHWNKIFMNNAVRLLNLHAKTIDTISRYRQRGEQRITVVHQNVNVVSNSVTMGEDKTKTNEIPHGQPRTNSDMSSEIQEIREPMPQLCHERQTCMPDTWREKQWVENKKGTTTAEGSQYQTWVS
jgi:hypothetical protein